MLDDDNRKCRLRSPGACGPALRAIVLSSSWSAFLLASCALDERPLQGFRVVMIEGEGGEGGRGDAGESGAGIGAEGGAPTGAGTGGAGGAAGSGGSSGASVSAGSSGVGGARAGAGGTGAGDAGEGGSPEPERCPDIDGNRVLDCEETLAENPSFDSDAVSWAPETGLGIAWHERDAHDMGNSGSLSVENQAIYERDGFTLLGARQCLPVYVGIAYQFASEVSVQSGETQAGIQVAVFDGPECSGNLIETKGSNLVEGSDWQVVDVDYFTPDQAKSALLRLLVRKPFRKPPQRVLFDNILVKTE